MRQRLFIALSALLLVGAVVGLIGIASADGIPPTHGISLTKGCTSPVKVGEAYSCSYTFQNNVDQVQDTLTVDAFFDTVHAAGGDQSSGNVFSQLRMVAGLPLAGYSTTPSCTGGASFSGNGTPTNPWVGATSCTLPFGSRIDVLSFSFYTVKAADFGNPNHQLLDDAYLGWHDTCDRSAARVPAVTNCAADPPQVSAASSAMITVPTTTATTIHSSGHGAVLVVDAGTTVHDFVTVTGVAGTPVPLGTVTFDWFTNSTCSGLPVVTSGSGSLVNGSLDMTSFTQGPLAAGLYGFKAHYAPLAGSGFLASDGECEPLRVVDANIQITPDGVNRVGQAHTFTAHVNVNDGTGFTNAPSGTQINFSVNGVPSYTCVTSNGSGSCSISYASALTGVDTVRASTTVAPGGLTISRTTNGSGLNSVPAVKRWVNAKIAIAPTATNEVGDPHTFVVTLQKDEGNGSFVGAAGEHVTVSLASTNNANAVVDAALSTCDDNGANTDAAGRCTIVFNSATAGKITGHASATLSVAGSAAFTVQTNGQGGSSVDAVKTYVDANIGITPPTATNRVGQPHVFTAHVDVNSGNGGFQSAPAGTLISFTKTGVGSFTGSDQCTTVNGTGSCSVTLVSTATGTTTVTAHVVLSVGGLSLTRHTDATGSNSAPAQKRWVDARITIAPDATNEVNQNHTFVATLEKDLGDGAGFVPAYPGRVSVTLTDANGAAHTPAAGTCTSAGNNINPAGRCSIMFTSATAGTVTARASALVNVNGLDVTVTTDGTGQSSAPAVKTFVDANIQVTPSGVNPVGQPHVFTAHLNVNDGSGVGFQNAPAGTPITLAIAPGGKGAFTTPNPCLTVGNTGSCTVTLVSNVPGVSTVSASSTVTLAGLAVTRTTNGVGANSDVAVKQWVAAKISIAPTAVNPVGAPHTFVVTVERDTGSGYGPAANEHVEVTLTDSNGAVHTAPTGSCTTAGPNTDANGRCTITFTSNTAGVVTAHATASLKIGTETVVVQTNGVAPSSNDAVKTFVDANIQIAPLTDVNPVGSPHVFTAHVNVNPGTGFVNAADGTKIDFEIVSGPGNLDTTTCNTSGGSGSCSVTLTSTTAGTTIVRASTSVIVNTQTLTRSTNGSGANSGPATKQWADVVNSTKVIDEATGADITNATVPVGTIVHDEAFVAKAAGTPAPVADPTGTVDFTLYSGLTCNGAVIDQHPGVALVGGVAKSKTYTALASGQYSFLAHYNGQAGVYPAKDAACEPFTIKSIPVLPPNKCEEGIRDIYLRNVGIQGNPLITVTNKDHRNDAEIIWFRGNAQYSTDLTIYPAKAGDIHVDARTPVVGKVDKKLGSFIYLYVGDAADPVTRIHTACSQPGGPGLLTPSPSLGIRPFLVTQSFMVDGTESGLTDPRIQDKHFPGKGEGIPVPPAVLQQTGG